MLELIEEFRNKARCRHTQGKAESIWHKLKPLLAESEAAKLQIAWAHAAMGEGPAELDAVCEAIKNTTNRAEP